MKHPRGGRLWAGVAARLEVDLVSEEAVTLGKAGLRDCGSRSLFSAWGAAVWVREPWARGVVRVRRDRVGAWSR